MGAFEYTAVDASGRERKGLLEGDTARQVRQLLRDQSLLPVTVNEVVQQERRQRKTGFKGEDVEVTPLMPTLVALVQLIDKDADAKTALSEFLRALETAGVQDQLTDKA